MSGFRQGTFPTRYLGIPLSTTYLKSRHYGGLIDKMRQRIDGWSAQSLSTGGRIELIKSVIHGMLNYWALSFKLPHKVISQINSLSLQFLWSSKLHTWCWEDICQPRREGGLGLRKLHDISRATGVKLFWQCVTGSGLLGQWLRDQYLKNNNIWDINASIHDSGTWKFIMASKQDALSCISYDAASDRWIWTQHKSGYFTFKSAWDSIRVQSLPIPYFSTIWISSHSTKMSICLLRAYLQKLPTKSKLHQLGIVSDTLCLLCNTAPETEHHLFFACPFTNRIWKTCCLKLNLHHSIQNLQHEVAVIHFNFRSKTRLAALAKQALAATVWHVWAERNRRAFQNASSTITSILNSIARDCTTLLNHCYWKHTPDPVTSKISSNWDIAL